MAFKRLIEIISGPEGGTATSVTNLYMSFEVERNKTNTPNKANVSIYNLSPNTMTKMESNKNKLIIRAGYDDETGLTTLFNGDVTKSERKKEGTEQVLEIEAMDGYKNIQSQNVSISYKSGTKTTTILRDILAAMAYPVAGGIPTSSDSYTGGFQYIGKAKDALTVVLKKIGYKWTIQNDQILIFKEIGGGSVVTGLLITPSTGLLSIEKLEQDTEEVKKTTYTNTKETEKKTTEKKKKRKKKATKTQEKKVPLYYTIETLLFPQLIPGAYLKIESDLFTGTVVVNSSKFSGDNYGGDFKVSAEVRVV